ncbi:MAG: glycine zipper 2TM domain-containing protein [Sphingomonadales bacterium]|nr:glycine zipper 2TM domain-containing protein [Sphingomonadales bacterium]MDE2569384.1 glycine zipper 2TM domain-containing protein [Sphingomonadales bacterium]
MNKTITAAMLVAFALPVSVPALADPPPWAPAHGRRAHDDERRYYRTDNGIRYWRDDRGGYRCRRADGTVGTLVGGVAGALVGRAIDTRGDRTTGTVLGAAAGALIGHEVAKSGARCR